MTNMIFDAKEVEALKQSYAQTFKQTATLLSTILRAKAQIVVSDCMAISLAEVIAKNPQPQVIAPLTITNDISGQGLFMFNQTMALALCQVLTDKRNVNQNSGLGQNELNVFSQLTGQIAVSVSASFSQLIGKKINFTPLDLKLSNIADEIKIFSPQQFDPGLQIVVVTARLTIDGITDDQFSHLISLNAAKELSSASYGKTSKSGHKVEALNLSQLDKSAGIAAGVGLGNLLVDIPLQLTVELGRSKMALKEILQLGVGSIIELERLAGEPVEILLNNKILATGEVVVIDENLGVRVTHIVNPNERI